MTPPEAPELWGGRGYKDAAQLADTVQRQRRLANLFERGETDYDLGNWAAAMASFEELRVLDASFRSVEVQEYLFESYVNDGLALIAGAGESVEPVKTGIQRFASALGIHPRDRVAIEERRLANLYLEGRTAYGKSDWEGAIYKMGEVYRAQADYAGGWAARTLYSAYVQRGNEYMAADNCVLALETYGRALDTSVEDKSLALEKQAEAQECVTPPTATASPTPSVSPTPPATATFTATATPPPTATPLPVTATPTFAPTATDVPTATDTPVPPPPPTDTPAPPPPTEEPPPPPPPTKEPTPPR